MASRDPEEFRRLLKAAQVLTTAYLKILQTPCDHFWSLSALPADKETMKAALKLDAAFHGSQGALDKPIEGTKITLRDTFTSTYAMLADFVPDDFAARVAPYWRFFMSGAERIKSGEIPDGKALSEELTRLAPSAEDEQASQKAHDEFATLADEMRAYLDRIVPPRAKEQ